MSVAGGFGEVEDWGLGWGEDERRWRRRGRKEGVEPWERISRKAWTIPYFLNQPFSLTK
jgi:hypothetical protein